jgi:PKD repeat protein
MKVQLQKNSLTRILSKILLLFTVNLIVLNVYAQAPSITTFSPITAAVGSSVTITGTNFNSTAANNVVFFGGVKASTPTAASSTSLTVNVPAGATFGNISVTNLSNRLTALSLAKFTPTYTQILSCMSSGNFTSGNFTTGSTTASIGANRTTIADMDNDGKADVLVTNNNVSSISVLRNISTSGTISLDTKIDFNVGGNPNSVGVGDIDGDGLLDVVVSNKGNDISVLINTSTSPNITFSSPITISAANQPREAALADFNGDGLLDLIYERGSANLIEVRLNTSTGTGVGNVSFGSPTSLFGGNGNVSVGLGDFDGDGKVDVVVPMANTSELHIWRNTSSLSTLSFTKNSPVLTSISQAWDIEVADFDDDGMLDLALSNIGLSNIKVLRNTSTTGAISFGSVQTFTTVGPSYGIGVGDINGDGKADIATSRPDVLFNNSTSGTISFTCLVGVAIGSNPISVAVGDLDNDGKPDIAQSNSNTTVTIYRTNIALSNNANLSSLSLSSGTLSPTFASGTTAYSSIVNSITSSITVTPTKTDAGASIQARVNGGTYATVTSGSASSALSLNFGTNTIDVKVTAEDGTTLKTYTITVTRITPPGNALAFDGSDDNVSINNTIGNFGTGDFTIETWVKTTSSSSGTIIAKRNANSNGNFFMLGYGSNGTIYLEINETNMADYTAITSTTGFNDGRWHHVAAIRNSGQLFLYIDGQQAATPVTINGNPNINNSVTTTLGQFLNVTNPWNRFNGSIDEVRIWNVARTTSEFIPNSFNPISASSTGLVAYYNFDNGIADGTNTGLNTLNDLTSNGNNGTLNNFGLTGSNSNWVESYAMVVPIFTTATNITNNGFTVNWNAPAIGTVDNGYRLTVSTSLTFATQIAGSPFSASSTSKTLTGLNPGTTYFYKVNADKTSVTGTGGYSQLNINTTLNPSISTTGTLSAFTACTGLVSAEQNFSVSGSNLSTDIIITPPSGYEVSTTSGSGFATSVSLTQTSGSVNSTTIYVRLTNSASGSPAGNISCTSTSATTQNIAVSGTVTSLPTISSATKLSYNGSDLTCNGQSNGQITVVGAGGTGALQYSNGGAYQVSNVFTGLGSNSYTLIVKDANGCLSSSSVVTINEPTALSGTVSNNGPICANTTLSLSGSIAGGTGSKTYSWAGPNAYTSTASATLARTVSANATVAMSGTYTLTAKDANNCTYNPTTNVVVNPIPTAGISGTTTLCKDAPSPNVTFTGANGTAPYTFTYNINGVGSYTVSTASAIDNSVDVVAPTNVSGTFTYNLVSVVDASSTLCAGSASGSAIVTIKPKPILSSTAAPVANTICEGTSTTVNCSNGASTLNAAVFTTAYSNNFSSSIGNAWTFPAIIPANVPSIQNYDGGSVLGYLSNQQAKLNLTSLPSHDSITVDFDLYIHDTWDGNSTVSGPDMFRVILDNDTALNTTFSNETWNSTTQSYPNNFSASNASFTGSLTRTLPTACNFGGGSLSAKYHITKKVSHTASTLEMILEAAGLENVCNESWSIDNVTVQYRSQSSNSNVTWTNPSIINNSITVSPIVNTYYVATLNGCSDSLQIIVNPTPRAGFTINTVNQCVTGNSYDFTDTTTLAGGGAMTYAWTMTGANTTSATTQNVTGNTYANHGSYNVRLVATSVIGNCNDSRGRVTKTVNVSPRVVITQSSPNPICAGNSVRLTANQVIGGSSTVVYTPTYTENFETAITNAWSFPAITPANVPTVQSYNGQNVLGYLTNQKAVYSQTGLASHDYVKVEFDLYLHDSWDGNSTDSIGGSLIGKDIWKMSVNGSNIINTTFSNFSYRTQAYPNNISAVNLNGTDAVSNTLPTLCNHNGGALSSVYRISKIIPHTSGSFNLELEALGLEELCNESWSIDNFNVELGVNTSTPNLLSACNGLPVSGGPVVYTVNHSNNFQSSIGSAWSFPAISPANEPTITEFNGDSVLGFLTNQQAIYTQNGLSAHEYVKVEFDLYIHDTWDGNDPSTGVDSWKMNVDGNSVINTTFSNFSYRTQAYPNNAPAVNANFTGSVNSTLPARCNLGGGAPSSKYRISKIIPHNTSTISIVLEALGLEELCNESWSIDNFQLSLGAGSAPVSSATWNGGAITGATSCFTDITPTTSTDYTVTIGACTSPITNIDVRPAPTPAFTISNASCSKTVSFTNTNVEANVTYLWNFGDGSVIYSGTTAPNHTYSAVGTYTMTLSANILGGCTRTTTRTIKIADAPTAGIAFTGGTGCGNSVQFTNTSTIPSGNTASYLWSFGETPVADTSTQESPLHSYVADGNYTVTLTVSTGTNCSASTTVSVNAIAAITGNQSIFSAVVGSSCGNMVTTTNSSTGTNNQYAWDFGDGSVSSEVAPTHYYTAGGFKTITLTILNGVGCATTSSKIVNISDNSGANGRVGVDFAIAPNTSQVLLTNDFGFEPTFTNYPNNVPVVYCAGAPTWTYGDGTGSSNTIIYSKRYASAGTYTVRIVQQTTNTGCFAEASKTVTVLPNPLLQNNPISFKDGKIASLNNEYSTGLMNVNNNNNNLTLYPNPNKGTFKFQLNSNEIINGEIKVVDLLGRDIYKANINGNTKTESIDLNSLSIAPGTYNLVILNNGNVYARKAFVIIAD